MKTTVKYVRRAKDGDKVYVNKYYVYVTDAVRGVVRNVDGYNVVTFELSDKCDKIAMTTEAFRAQLHNNVAGKHQTMVNQYLADNKTVDVEQDLAIMNKLLAGATFDVEWKDVEKPATDTEPERTVVEYTLSNIQLSDVALFMVGMNFVRSTLGITDPKLQMEIVETKLGIKFAF